MPDQPLLLATSNPGKIAEFRAILRGIPFLIRTPDEIGLRIEVEETGSTFAENAALKACAYADAAGMLALADDSGMEIDALGGAPGVYSARWPAPGVSYPERFRLLEERLRDVPEAERTARFRCAIAVAAPAPRGLLGVVEGTLEGAVATTPRGSGGFGYDPIFLVPAAGRTVGEMAPEEKHAISHRARAAAAARGLLLSLAPDAPHPPAPSERASQE